MPRSRLESVAAHASAGILVYKLQELNTLCMLLSYGAPSRADVRDMPEDAATGRGDALVEATQEIVGGGKEQFHDHHDDHFQCTTDGIGIRAGIEGFRRSRNDMGRLR